MKPERIKKKDGGNIVKNQKTIWIIWSQTIITNDIRLFVMNPSHLDVFGNCFHDYICLFYDDLWYLLTYTQHFPAFMPGHSMSSTSTI